MSPFLCIQNTYTHVECGLFVENLIDQVIIPKHDASAQLIPQLDTLLRKHNLTLTDLSCIGVNQGPGPFTTLRTVIATVNGIAFATDIPLIGIDGLKALLGEHASTTGITVALLNAFNKEVYFGIARNGIITSTGYKKAVTLLEELRDNSDGRITLIGSGVEIYESDIKTILGDKAHIASPLPLAPSLKYLGTLTRERLHKKEQLSEQLFPLYLKTQQFDQIA